MTDPSHQQRRLGTPISCSVGCVTAGGGGRQRPEAHPPSRLSRQRAAAEEFSEELGSVLTLRQGVISAAAGGGRAVCESELRRAELLHPGHGTLPGDSPAHSHGTHKSGRSQGLRMQRGVLAYYFKQRVYFGSSVFNFPSFMTH